MVATSLALTSAVVAALPGTTDTQQKAHLASMTSAPASSSLWRVTSAASTTRAALRLICTSWGSGSRCCRQSGGFCRTKSLRYTQTGHRSATADVYLLRQPVLQHKQDQG